jgi:hypothetical protein
VKIPCFTQNNKNFCLCEPLLRGNLDINPL